MSRIREYRDFLRLLELGRDFTFVRTFDTRRALTREELYEGLFGMAEIHGHDDKIMASNEESFKRGIGSVLFRPNQGEFFRAKQDTLLDQIRGGRITASKVMMVMWTRDYGGGVYVCEVGPRGPGPTVFFEIHAGRPPTRPQTFGAVSNPPELDEDFQPYTGRVAEIYRLAQGREYRGSDHLPGETPPAAAEAAAPVLAPAAAEAAAPALAPAADAEAAAAAAATSALASVEEADGTNLEDWDIDESEYREFDVNGRKRRGTRTGGRKKKQSRRKNKKQTRRNKRGNKKQSIGKNKKQSRRYRGKHKKQSRRRRSTT